MAIHILCIVPYEQMSVVIRETASQYDDFNIDIVEAFYQESAEFPEFIYENHFDAIISRGGTAYFLSKRVKIPVFEIPVSFYDLLRVLSQARQLSESIALTSYTPICENAKYLCAFLGWNIAVYPFESSMEIEDRVRQCTQDGYDLIIGGQATAAFAESYGARFLPVSTGKESIEIAFRNAANFFHYFNLISEKTSAFQSVIDMLPSSVFVNTADGTALYSNKAAYSLINSQINTKKVISELITSMNDSSDLHVIKKIGTDFYNVDGVSFDLIKNDPDSRRYVFQINYRSPVYKKYSPVSISSSAEVRKDLLNVPCLEPYFHPFSTLIQASCKSSQTILIQGETGTLKNVLARQIFLNCPTKTNSFIIVDCSMLTENSWNDILNSSSHIIHGIGHVLFFNTINACDMSMQKQLLSYAVASNLFGRHKCIFSSSVSIPSLVVEHKFLSELYFLISRFCINLPPLRERWEELPQMVNYMIPRFNQTHSKVVAGIDPEGMKMLVACDWPLNMMGLISTVSQMVASTDSYQITAAEVQLALTKQSTSFSPDYDLSEGSLEEIEKKIITTVLKKEGMNQSAAAKRLNIGRSTLRRKLGL